jgi:DNA recombination protein RmuC
MQERVIISTPTILLALLHTIALGWRQENIAENAKYIIKMGQELYKRLSDMTQYISTLGRNINSAVQSYNSTVASLESRVLVSARKFKELEVHEKKIIELSSIEESAKPLRSVN